MKKLMQLVKWYLKGLTLRLGQGNGTSYNAFNRWQRENDSRKNGRHSSRMRGANDEL